MNQNNSATAMTRRKTVFLILFVLLQLSLVWPIYPLFSGIRPMILGFPLSFAWVVFILICFFFLLLWYYLSDPQIESNRRGDK